jgi:CRP/FNR family transcriptional regulator, cyclic AMP receptor protein
MLLPLARFGLSDPESEAQPVRLPVIEADALLQAGRARTLPAQAVLCNEGESTDRFFIVTSGEVEIAKSIAGKSFALSTTGPGSVLALMPALDGGPCAVSLRALRDTTVVEVTRSSLFSLIDPDQASASNLVYDLALVAIRRLRTATDELSQTLFQSLRSSPRAGRIDPPRMARIQADNHAWPSVRLAA